MSLKYKFKGLQINGEAFLSIDNPGILNYYMSYMYYI